jgi:ABC-2 type transport system ATP-binding protein
MDEADKLCDRLVIIDHGKFIAEGTPSELKRKVAKTEGQSNLATVTLEDVFIKLTGKQLENDE